MSEVSTGAVRSTDLATERWDLISGIALSELSKYHRPGLYNQTPVENVGQAYYFAHEFIGGVRFGNPLARGMAHLAAAIQQSEDDYYDWLRAANYERMPSDGQEAWWFLPHFALKSLAATCHEGAIKYGENNWLFGFPVTGLLNHLTHHLSLWLHGDTTEDHLGHALWGFMTSIHMSLTRPDMCTGLLGPDYAITDDIKAELLQHAARRKK